MSLQLFEQQTDEGAVAADEAAFQDESSTLMAIPNELVPVVLELIDEHAGSRQS